jgi:hypothetical protein
VSNKKAAAIAEILKMRDQLVVMRERLFQLTAATAVRTKEVDGLLIDCAGAGRVFGVRIGLPDWNNVLGWRAGRATSGSLLGEASSWGKAGRKSQYPYSRLISEAEDDRMKVRPWRRDSSEMFPTGRCA